MYVVQGEGRWGIREKVDPIRESGQRYGPWAEWTAGPEEEGRVDSWLRGGRQSGQLAQRDMCEHCQLPTSNVHTCLLRTLTLALTNTEKRTEKKPNT